MHNGLNLVSGNGVGSPNFVVGLQGLISVKWEWWEVGGHEG